MFIDSATNISFSIKIEFIRSSYSAGGDKLAKKFVQISS